MKRNTKNALISSALSLVLCFSMLIGSTFAWFTDSVSSERNVILAGNLDVEVEYLDKNGRWTELLADSNVFDGRARWEPGYTETVYLRIRNAGELAMKYALDVRVADERKGTNVNGEPFALSEHIRFGITKDVKEAFESRDAAMQSFTESKPLAAGYHTAGNIAPHAEEQYVAITVFMPTTVGNECNAMKGTRAADISLGLYVNATQASYEEDGFGDNGFDADAPLPQIPDYFSASTAVTKNADDRLAGGATIGGASDDMNAELPGGVLLDENADAVTLEVKKNIKSEANFTVQEGVATRSFDVHIDGVSKQNDVPITVKLGKILPAGLKDSSVRLYHVENGVTNEMALVTAFTAHNQFTYDRATGEVSIYIATFSEITMAVAITDPWDGTVDTSWYNDTATEFELDSAEDLAGLGALVSAGNTFLGKTVKLAADIDLGGEGSEHVFYPIGYKSETPNEIYAFEGTFDGQGHIIRDLYQNTWNIKGNYNGTYYNLSLGLFANLVGATVCNLVLENFIMEGEYAPAGCVAGCAEGGTFRNISLHKCAPATYNTGVGGIIGWDEGDGVSYLFEDIRVDSTNTVIALWGSYDVACAGIMGFMSATSAVTMRNCTVGARLDVYNDVCANYQYYQYRYSGMLVGTIGYNSVPASENLTCENCEVYIGSWANYYYCEFEKNSSASYTEDFQFSRVDEKDIVFDLQGNPISCTHTHTTNEDKLACYLPFSQLYTGYKWGASPAFSHPGVTVIKDYAYTVTYMQGTSVLDVSFVADNTVAFTALLTAPEGYQWVDGAGNAVTQIAQGNEHDVVLYLGAIAAEKYIARFVDRDGVTVYEEEFSKNQKTLNYVPDVPNVQGYKGVWESYTLNNADIVIRPVYSVGDATILDSTITTAQLFTKLESGESVIMSQDMSGAVAGANKATSATITKDVRMDLNTFEFNFTSNHNANKAWTIFKIENGAKLTLGGGLSGAGNLVFTFDALNGNARPCIFNVVAGGTLVLERGVTIEIRCAKESDIARVSLIDGINYEDSNLYPGFNVLKAAQENGYWVTRIVVTGTTTMTAQ